MRAALAIRAPPGTRYRGVRSLMDSESRGKSVPSFRVLEYRRKSLASSVKSRVGNSPISGAAMLGNVGGWIPGGCLRTVNAITVAIEGWKARVIGLVGSVEGTA